MCFRSLISPRGQKNPKFTELFLTFTAGRATVPAENMDRCQWQIVQPIGGDPYPEWSVRIGC